MSSQGRFPHNPKVEGSNPSPATNLLFLTDPPPGVSIYFKSSLVSCLRDLARKYGKRLTGDHAVI